jgi:hypothetical protein
MYDPSVGRWISEDPIEFLGGDANLARYVSNRSLSYVDPLGLAELTKPQQALLDKLLASDSYKKLTPEQQKAYLQAFMDAIGKLNDKVAEELLAKIITFSMLEQSGDTTAAEAAGAFDSKQGILYGSGKSVTSEILHEFGHALDSPKHIYSATEAWLVIWGEEIRGKASKLFEVEDLEKAIKDGTAPNDLDKLRKLKKEAFPVSEYACKDTAEGFAEFFAHAILNPQDAKKRFPKAFGYMVGRGLLSQ